MATKKATQKTQRRARFAKASALPKQTRGRTTAERTPLVVRTRDVDLDPKLRAYFEKRVALKLARFALSINRVVVRLERPSGPTGSPAFACQFSITTAGEGKVVVEAVEPDARAAFDAAGDAAERAVRRLLERRASKKTRRPAKAASRRGR